MSYSGRDDEQRHEGVAVILGKMMEADQQQAHEDQNEGEAHLPHHHLSAMYRPTIVVRE